MADLVRNANGIENQVQSVVSGIEEIVSKRPRISFRKIARAIFDTLIPANTTVQFSQEQAMAASIQHTTNAISEEAAKWQI